MIEKRKETVMTDEEYMRLALAEAEQAGREGEIPIGAVLVYRDAVIAADHNRRETDLDPTAHAEVLVLRRGALRLSRWRLTECTLYVTIEPCAMCAGAIMNARVSRLVYGAADVREGGVDSRFHICEGAVMNHRLAVRSGVLAGECGGMVERFFLTHRR